MPDSFLDMAKQDFTTHVSGDHIFQSVYTDLQNLKSQDIANGGDINAQFSNQLGDLNNTVRTCLPGVSIVAIDDKGSISMQKDGSAAAETFDASKAAPSDLLLQTSANTTGTDSKALADIYGDPTKMNVSGDSTRIAAVTADSTTVVPAAKADSTIVVPITGSDSTHMQGSDSTHVQGSDSTHMQGSDSTHMQGTTAENTNAGAAGPVTKDAQTFPTDVRYPADASGKQHETKFEYDDSAGFHRLVKVTKDDGTVCELITDPTDKNAGQWKVSDSSGKSSVMDLQVMIDLDGNWGYMYQGKRVWENTDGTVTNTAPGTPTDAGTTSTTGTGAGADGTATTTGTGTGTDGTDTKTGTGTGTDGGAGKDNNSGDANAVKPDDKAVAAQKELLTEAIQKVGEGPWQAAERMLPGGSYAEIHHLTRLLKRYYQEHNNDNTDRLVTLKVGQPWLTADNFDEIMSKSPALKARYDKMQAA